MKINNLTQRNTCMGVLFIVIMNILIGGWSVNTILSWFGKDINYIADMIIGLFTGAVTIPLAILGTLLKLVGLL